MNDRSLEFFIEKLLFASRWLLAPLYLGLAIALVALGVKIFQESWHLISAILVTKEKDLVLIILALVDMVLVGRSADHGDVQRLRKLRLQHRHRRERGKAFVAW